MAARTLPTLPSFAANSVATSAQLNQLATYSAFWANPPSFKMFQSVSQNITSGGGNQQVTLDTGTGTAAWDTDGGRSSTSPYNYTIPFYGRWEFKWSVAYGSNATGSRVAILYQNGARVAGDVEGAADNDVVQLEGAMTVLCSVGDTIGLWTWQNSGSTLATGVGASNCSFLEGRLVSLANP